MKSWVLVASLLAAATMIPAASYAADPGDDDDVPGAYKRKAPPPGYNNQYDDDDDDDRPPAKRYSGPPPAPPPGYKYSGPPVPPAGMNCARSEQVRQRLTEMGWQDFHGGQQQGDVVVMKARRPSGRLFELTLQRCSGQIVEVRPLEGRPYAFNNDRPPYDDRYNRPNAERYDYPPPRGPYGYNDRYRDGPYAYGGPRRWWWND